MRKSRSCVGRDTAQAILVCYNSKNKRELLVETCLVTTGRVFLNFQYELSAEQKIRACICKNGIFESDCVLTDYMIIYIYFVGVSQPPSITCHHCLVTGNV